MIKNIIILLYKGNEGRYYLYRFYISWINIGFMQKSVNFYTKNKKKIFLLKLTFSQFITLFSVRLSLLSGCS